MLEVRDYTLAYDAPQDTITALNAVNLDVRPGETHALVGESGSGKSTLAWAIMRYLPRNAHSLSGRIMLSGEDLLTKTQGQMESLRGRRVAMVFQDPSSSLNPTMRMGDQIAEVLVRHQGLSQEAAWTEGEAALTRTGIARPAEIMRRYPHQASGGEKQRVVIASAFACNPELIIFDEPTTALDILTAQQILDLFLRLRAETGVAALYISHDLGLVSRIADRVSVIHRGKIVESGQAHDVFRAPKDDYTRKLMAAVPKPDDRIAVAEPIKTEPLLSVRGITVRYDTDSWLRRMLGREAESFFGAQNVGFDIRPGELLGLVGASGSGKSTMAQVISGLRDFQGEVHFNGRRFDRRQAFDRAYRREVQIVFQHPDASLNPSQTIGSILSRPLRLYGLVPRSKVADRIRELLEMVLLPAEFASRYPHELSGGQKQRVAIARAFAAEPKLVICDEITAALDVSVQAAVARLLTDLQRKTGAACLFITHDLNLIRQLAHRIAVMQRGRLVDTFDVAQAEEPDRDAYTRALLEAVPLPAEFQGVQGE
ncbi:ABC transporter ATP-binding protein [Mesorhizobium sp. 8]|uniref:nickel ABC transporter ATP-binding protein NikE n=1 Tax=Mesorhizobium sp. 8 TaxID=2584466 RepID=UPI001FEE2249|nr:ABC transporter ATP-binding protein [Mesorhizobium sp. 8]